MPSLPAAIPFTCGVLEPDCTVRVPSCDDCCRLGIDLEWARRAVEVPQDGQVHGVPFARDFFPIRDHPSALASGGAEPVVSPCAAWAE